MPKDDLSSAWRICTKVKEALENGSRLENLSWRLWFLHDVLQEQTSSKQQFKREFKKVSAEATRKLEASKALELVLPKGKFSKAKKNARATKPKCKQLAPEQLSLAISSIPISTSPAEAPPVSVEITTTGNLTPNSPSIQSPINCDFQSFQDPNASTFQSGVATSTVPYVPQALTHAQRSLSVDNLKSQFHQNMFDEGTQPSTPSFPIIAQSMTACNTQAYASMVSPLATPQSVDGYDYFGAGLMMTSINQSAPYSPYNSAIRANALTEPQFIHSSNVHNASPLPYSPIMYSYPNLSTHTTDQTSSNITQTNSISNTATPANPSPLLRNQYIPSIFCPNPSQSQSRSIFYPSHSTSPGMHYPIASQPVTPNQSNLEKPSGDTVTNENSTSSLSSTKKAPKVPLERTRSYPQPTEPPPVKSNQKVATTTKQSSHRPEFTRGSTNPIPGLCRNCGVTSSPLWRRSNNDEQLCNACGLYAKSHRCPRPKALKANAARKDALNSEASSLISSSSSSENLDDASKSKHVQTCTNCETKTTPLWRRDSIGAPLCNACGLYSKLHNQKRPVQLKTDVIKKRQRFDSNNPRPESISTSCTRAPATLKPKTHQSVIKSTTSAPKKSTKNNSVNSSNFASIKKESNTSAISTFTDSAPTTNKGNTSNGNNDDIQCIAPKFPVSPASVAHIYSISESNSNQLVAAVTSSDITNSNGSTTTRSAYSYPPIAANNNAIQMDESAFAAFEMGMPIDPEIDNFGGIENLRTDIGMPNYEILNSDSFVWGPSTFVSEPEAVDYSYYPYPESMGY